MAAEGQATHKVEGNGDVRRQFGSEMEEKVNEYGKERGVYSIEET